MVKIAVLADLHLGFGLGSERENDCYNQAAEAFNKALSQDPDLLLLLGDLFHKKIPTQETLGKAITFFSEVKKQFNKEVNILESKGNRLIQKKKIPAIVTIYGTHERRNEGHTNPVHILEKANLLYCLDKESILIQLNGQRIGIHGLSGTPEQFVREELKKWNPEPFEKAINFFLIHQTFNDIIPAKEEKFLEFKELPVGFDVYLLGHIHWKVEEKHPITGAPILIPGSTVKTQLREIESKKEKGFYILDLFQNQIKIKFIPIKTRPFIFEKINVNNKKPSEILNLLSEKLISILQQEYKEKPLIRFKLEGKLAEGFLPSDLNLKSITDNYKDKSILNIDKSSLTSSELEERENFLRELIKNKESIDKIGLKLLSDSLNFSDPNLEKLFEFLATGDLKSAEEIINKLDLK